MKGGSKLNSNIEVPLNHVQRIIKKNWPTPLNKHAQQEEPGELSIFSSSDLRDSLDWIVQSNTRTIIVAIFFLVAGIASFLGHLRWQHALFRISFALACWLIVFVISLCSARRN